MYMTIDEKAEYHELMRKAWPPDRADHDTAACAERMRDLLVAEDVAGKRWPAIILNRVALSGCQGVGKAWSKKHNRILVPVGGGVSAIARRRGVKRQTENGTSEDHQVLIQTMNWQELEGLIRTIISQVGALMVNQGALNRLLKLRDRHPATTGPADAAKVEGTTVEAVMAGEWMAA